jgi:methyl-accepting chemotaxis protein
MTAKKAQDPAPDERLICVATAVGQDLVATSLTLVFDAKTKSLWHASADAINLLELSADGLSASGFLDLCDCDAQDIADLWWTLAAGGSAEWSGHLTASLSMTRTPARFRAVHAAMGDGAGSVAVLAQRLDDEPRMSAEPAASGGPWAALKDFVGVIEYDTDGNVISANDRAAMALEYVDGDIAGRNHEVLWPQSVTATPNYIEFWEKLRQGRIVEGRHQHRSAEGGDLWFQSTFVPVRGEDGRIARVVQCLMDVTEEAGSAARDRMLLDAVYAGVSILEYDPEGHVVRASGAMLDALGQSAEDLGGKHNRRLLDAEFARTPGFMDAWSIALKGVPQIMDVHHVRKNRDSLWTRSAFLPAKDASGAVQRIIEVAVDIHEMHERLADHDLRHAATNSVLSVMEIDLAGKIISANAAACSLFDTKQSVLASLDFRSLVPKDFGVSKGYQTFFDRLARGETVSGTFQRRRPDETTLWVRGHHVPLVLEGQDVADRILVLMTDVTEEHVRRVRSESKFAMIERSLAVAELDLDGAIAWTNRVFEDALGYTAQELASRTITSILPKDDADQHRARWEALRNGESVEVEARLIGNQGRDVWISGTFNPLLDEGKVTRIIVLASIVTDQKHRVHDLQEKWKAVTQAVRRPSSTPTDASCRRAKVSSR